jgi:hypothetical protein
LADSPRAYWRLGEAIGSAAADEMATAAGAYLSGVTLGVASALATGANTSASFDGGDDRVTMGDPSTGALDFGLGDFSAEPWVRATANDERAIFSKRPVGAGLSFWHATVTDDGSRIGRVRVNLSDGVTSVEVYGPAVRVDDGAWHHVVVVFDRDSGIVIYVDGVAQTTSRRSPGTSRTRASSSSASRRGTRSSRAASTRWPSTRSPWTPRGCGRTSRRAAAAEAPPTASVQPRARRASAVAGRSSASRRAIASAHSTAVSRDVSTSRS